MLCLLIPKIPNTTRLWFELTLRRANDQEALKTDDKLPQNVYNDFRQRIYRSSATMSSWVRNDSRRLQRATDHVTFHSKWLSILKILGDTMETPPREKANSWTYAGHVIEMPMNWGWRVCNDGKLQWMKMQNDHPADASSEKHQVD